MIEILFPQTPPTVPASVRVVKLLSGEDDSHEPLLWKLTKQAKWRAKNREKMLVIWRRQNARKKRDPRQP